MRIYFIWFILIFIFASFEVSAQLVRVNSVSASAVRMGATAFQLIVTGSNFSKNLTFGCTPWIDFEHNYKAILLVNSNVPTATVMWNEIRPLIIEQMRQNN